MKLGLEAGLDHPDRCDVSFRAGCDAVDGIVIRRAVLGLAPGIQQACPDAPLY